MASDVYLQLDGITGESLDSAHKGWIEVSNVHWNITQPRSASASTSGGHTAARAELSPVTFFKSADLATPKLMELCASGKTIAKAQIEFFRADGGGGKPIKYFQIELTNVLVAAIAGDHQPGDLLGVHVSLAYGKIVWKYVQQKVEGGTSGNTMGGWSSNNNTVAA